MRELIKAQEKTAVSQAEQLLKKIQREIAELKMNEAELDKLSHTEDQILFLQVKVLRFFQFPWTLTHPAHLELTVSPGLSPQSCQYLQAPPALSALPPLTADPSLSFGPVMTAVSDFKGLLQEVCQEGFVCIYERGRHDRLTARLLF